MWVLPDVRPMIIQTCTSMKDQCKSSFFISSDKLTKVQVYAMGKQVNCFKTCTKLNYQVNTEVSKWDFQQLKFDTQYICIFFFQIF